MSGNWNKDREFSSDDARVQGPRFRGGNIEKKVVLVESLRAIATEKHATVAQLVIAWVLSKGNDVIPLIGARTPSQLQDSIGALELELSISDVSRIEEAVTPELIAGEYYAAARKKWFVSDTVRNVGQDE